MHTVVFFPPFGLSSLAEPLLLMLFSEQVLLSLNEFTPDTFTVLCAIVNRIAF